jgi:hypothetical protein
MQAITSVTQRSAYMRFLRRMARKNTATLYPSAAKKFANPLERTTLFIDFFKQNEDLQKVELVQRRRHQLKQEGSTLYTKMTEIEMLARFNDDADYVARIKAECVALRRFSHDRYAPTDSTKTKYWVLDKETVTISEGLTLETELELAMEADSEAVQHLTTGTGLFNVGNGLQIDSFGHAPALADGLRGESALAVSNSGEVYHGIVSQSGLPYCVSTHQASSHHVRMCTCSLHVTHVRGPFRFVFLLFPVPFCFVGICALACCVVCCSCAR